MSDFEELLEGVDDDGGVALADGALQDVAEEHLVGLDACFFELGVEVEHLGQLARVVEKLDQLLECVDIEAQPVLVKQRKYFCFELLGLKSVGIERDH